MSASAPCSVSKQDQNKTFQVLALSGGGYRGLYTAKVLADIEQELQSPIATKFDLITGTSIGGILALALALEIPAQTMVDLFVKHGEEIFKKRWSFLGIMRAPYSPASLKAQLEASEVFGDRLLGACIHPVMVPSINYTTAKRWVQCKARINASRSCRITRGATQSSGPKGLFLSMGPRLAKWAITS